MNIQKPKIPLKKEEETKKFKLIISKDIEKKIRRLCSAFNDKEWSGPLFFKETSGSIMDVESLVIEAVDLFPADLGSASYTEYDNMDRINTNLYSHQEYMDDKDLLEASIGHIHSHNTMPSFFSGTDDTELVSHAKNHDYYLSLIVNNNMQCVAKICETVEIINTQKIIGRNKIPTIIEKKSSGVIKYDAIIEFENSEKIEDEYFEKAMSALEKHISIKTAKSYQPGYGSFDIQQYKNTYGNKFATNITSPESKKNKFVGNSEDLAIAILSGWIFEEEFNYESPTLIDFEEFVDFFVKDQEAFVDLQKTLPEYIYKYIDKIHAICKDYNIPAKTVKEIIEQIEFSFDAELAPWNSDYYNPMQVITINKIINVLKSLNP